MPRKKLEDEDYEIGSKAAFLKYRSIKDCLNCPKPACNGCPISEREDPRWGFTKEKERKVRC